MNSAWKFAAPIFILVAFAAAAAAQQPDPASGIHPFDTVTGSAYDTVNLATSNIMISIPIRTKTLKVPLSLKLVGNSHVACCDSTGSISYWGVSSFWSQGQGAPFAQIFGTLGASLRWSTRLGPYCNGNTTQDTNIYYMNFVVVDSTGAGHPLSPSVFLDNGGCEPTSQSGTTMDGTGYTVNITAGPPIGNISYTIFDKSGNQQAGPSATNLIDSDGQNVFTGTTTVSGTTVTTTLQDELGGTFITEVTSDAPSTTPQKFEYIDANGGTQTATANFSEYTQQTNFGCASPLPQDAPNSQTVYLPSSIVLADGETFGMTYEPTPGHAGSITGRIAKLTLPLGGAISYTYSGGNNGLQCQSQVVPTLQRTITDGNGHSSTWTYVNTNTAINQQQETGGSTVAIPNFTVTVTDPYNNITVYNYSALETQEQVYQGSISTSNLLRTTVTCYNQNFTNCATATVAAPGQGFISQTDVYTYLSGVSAPSLVETKFNITGTIAEVKKYDFGATIPPSGSPISDTVMSYGSWNGSSCSNLPNNKLDVPCVITVNSPSGMASQVRYTYSSGGHPHADCAMA